MHKLVSCIQAYCFSTWVLVPAYTSIYTQTQACTHTHTRACMHAHTHVCSDAHTHTHSSMNHSESDSQLWKLWWLQGKCIMPSNKSCPTSLTDWAAPAILVPQPAACSYSSGFIYITPLLTYAYGISFSSTANWLWPSFENNLNDVHYLAGVQLAKSNSKQELCRANMTNLTFI